MSYNIIDFEKKKVECQDRVRFRRETFPKILSAAVGRHCNWFIPHSFVPLENEGGTF